MSSLVLVENPMPGVRELVLNRPDKRNALSKGLLEVLDAQLVTAEQDPALRIVVLRGAGSAFSAGMDLAEAGNPELAPQLTGLVERILHRLSESSLILVAAVHGAALAGGAGIMSACDFVIAAEGTKLGYPEVHRGLIAAMVMTLLRRQLHERDARELLLLGDIWTAERALNAGLINRVVPSEELTQSVEELCRKLLAASPAAQVRSKQLLAELWPRTLGEDLTKAHAMHLRAREDGDAAEGMQAFLEKRPPRWKPRPMA